MPMDAKLSAVLKEKLGDLKHVISGKDTAVIEAVESWHDKMEAAEKIQASNADLTKKRDDLEKEITSLKDKVKTGEAELERYRKDALTDADRKKFDEWKKKGMTTEVEGELNTLREKLDKAEQKYIDIEKKMNDSAAATEKAQRDKATSDLRSDLTTSLAKFKITKNATLALNTIFGEGLASLNDKGERVFQVKRDGKPYSLSTADELAEEFAKQNEVLVDASGKAGPGGGGTPTKAGSPATEIPEGASRRDLQNAAASMMSGPKK
jgi:chromosome segregation ATPase